MAAWLYWFEKMYCWTSVGAQCSDVYLKNISWGSVFRRLLNKYQLVLSVLTFTQQISVGAQCSDIYSTNISWCSVFWRLLNIYQLVLSVPTFTQQISVGAQCSDVYSTNISWCSVFWRLLNKYQLVLSVPTLLNKYKNNQYWNWSTHKSHITLLSVIDIYLTT